MRDSAAGPAAAPGAVTGRQGAAVGRRRWQRRRMLWLLPAAVSTVACFALQHGSASAFPALVPGYAKLEERKRLDWDTRIVGLAHGARRFPARAARRAAHAARRRAALVVGLGSLWVVLDPPAPIVDDRFFGYSDESQLFISIAFGYFICGPPASPRPPRSARGRRNGADGGWIAQGTCTSASRRGGTPGSRCTRWRA